MVQQAQRRENADDNGKLDLTQIMIVFVLLLFDGIWSSFTSRCSIFKHLRMMVEFWGSMIDFPLIVTGEPLGTNICR